jgi:hypothetical protein
LNLKKTPAQGFFYARGAGTFEDLDFAIGEIDIFLTLRILHRLLSLPLVSA